MTYIAHSDLLDEIAEFCEARKLSKSEFGKFALKDPRFVYDLEKGRECLPRTVRRVREAMTTPQGKENLTSEAGA